MPVSGRSGVDASIGQPPRTPLELFSCRVGGQRFDGIERGTHPGKQGLRFSGAQCAGDLLDLPAPYGAGRVERRVSQLAVAGDHGTTAESRRFSTGGPATRSSPGPPAEGDLPTVRTNPADPSGFAPPTPPWPAG